MYVPAGQNEAGGEGRQARGEERKGEPENMSSQEDGTGGVWPQPAHAETERVACKCKCMRHRKAADLHSRQCGALDAGERLRNVDFERL